MKFSAFECTYFILFLNFKIGSSKYFLDRPASISVKVKEPKCKKKVLQKKLRCNREIMPHTAVTINK